MNNSCLSLLKELEKKDIIKPEELKRAEFYLQFSDDPDFTRLDQAAQWVIDNLQVGEQRAAEIAQKLKAQFPNSSPSVEKSDPLLVQDEDIVQFAKQTTFANQTAPKLNDAAQQAENKEESAKQEANKAAFEHNKRLLFRCYSGGLINMEQYRQAHSLLHKHGAILLPNQETVLDWLIKQKIYLPNRKMTVNNPPAQPVTAKETNKESGWIKKVCAGFLVCSLAVFGIVKSVSGERVNICDRVKEGISISTIFKENGLSVIGKPELLLLYGNERIRTCPITFGEEAEASRLLYRFNLPSANTLGLNYLFIYRLLPVSSMNELEQAFIKKIREIDNKQIEQALKKNGKTFSLLESHFLDISSNPALCKKMSQHRYSCPVNILYNESESNDLTLTFTVSFDFLLKDDDTWQLITADREVNRRLLKVTDRAIKTPFYGEKLMGLKLN